MTRQSGAIGPGSVRSEVRDGERGSSTVLVAALVGAGAVVLVLLLGLGEVVRARAVAQTAADLGAVAAATATARPTGLDPCGTAIEAVTRAGAELTGCELIGRDVAVTTRVPTTVGDAVARARAGPAA